MINYFWEWYLLYGHLHHQMVWFYSLSHKTVNTRENFWNVYCFATNQMRDKTAKDNRQTAAWISLDFIRQRAGFFFQGTGFSSMTNLPIPNYRTWNRPRSDCKLSKFTTVQVFGKRLLSYKKIRIENHQSQPTSMTLSTAREANTGQPRF